MQSGVIFSASFLVYYFIMTSNALKNAPFNILHVSNNKCKWFLWVGYLCKKLNNILKLKWSLLKIRINHRSSLNSKPPHWCILFFLLRFVSIIYRRIRLWSVSNALLHWLFVTFKIPTFISLRKYLFVWTLCREYEVFSKKNFLNDLQIMITPFYCCSARVSVRKRTSNWGFN